MHLVGSCFVIQSGRREDWIIAYGEGIDIGYTMDQAGRCRLIQCVRFYKGLSCSSASTTACVRNSNADYRESQIDPPDSRRRKTHLEAVLSLSRVGVDF